MSREQPETPEPAGLGLNRQSYAAAHAEASEPETARDATADEPEIELQEYERWDGLS